MKRHWLRFAGLTLMLGFLAVPSAHADTRWSFNVRVGQPRVVYAPPPGYVWEPAHYAWTGYRNVWVPGHWVRERYYDRRWYERDRRYDGRWRR